MSEQFAWIVIEPPRQEGHREVVVNRFSLRDMLVLFVIVSVVLTFSQFDVVLSAGGLVLVLAISGMFLQPRNWRCLAYGSVFGIATGIVLTSIYGWCATGVFIPSNYQESNALGEVIRTVRPYVVSMGALAGATLALVRFGKRQHSET